MTVYVISETPVESGRITDFRMVPPPGGTTENQVLVWNAAEQRPEWRPASELEFTVTPGPTYAPLTTDSGQWLVTDTGARLVGLVS